MNTLNSTSKWSCTGGRDGVKPHTECLNSKETCKICGLTAAPTRLPQRKKFLFFAGLGTIAVIGSSIALTRQGASIACPVEDCAITIGIVLPQRTATPSATPSTSANLQTAGTCASNNLALPPQSLMGSRPQPPNYGRLKTYLEEKLAQQYKRPITVKFDRSIAINQPGWIEQAEQKLRSRTWDVAFTVSPLLATTARTHQYRFVANLSSSRLNQDHLEMALFVNQDSPIRSIRDIPSGASIALTHKENVPGFYMPIYDLYTKRLSVEMNHPVFQIPNLVSCNKVDVGVGFYQVIDQLPQFRVIHRSRSIPLGGIYLSSQLPSNVQETVKQLLINAPSDIQSSAAYRPGEEDVSSLQRMKQIQHRVNQILSCVDLQQQPVVLGCFPAKISGTVDGVSLEEPNIILRLPTDQGSFYQVVLPQPLFETNIKPTLQLNNEFDLHGKRIEVNGVQPIAKGGLQALEITDPKQIQLLNTQL